MSDNARFHNKLHRRNHHTNPTIGYPDSGTDPIASPAEPFQGTFVVNGDISASGAISSVYYTLSNISIAAPVLSANVGFQPTTSLIIQLSGIKYAVPVTLVNSNTFNGSSSGINSLSAGVTYLGGTFITGSLSGTDSDTWNRVYAVVSSASASWANGNDAFTQLVANSGNWDNTYTTLCAASANWESATISDTWVRANSASINNAYNTSIFSQLSTQALTFITATSSIVTSPASLNNIASGNFSNVLGGQNNTASSYAAIVVGGNTNAASKNYAIVAGGCSNFASGSASFIGGGSNNNIAGDCSAILGGCSNTISPGYTNVFVIGSNIDVSQPDFTYVNNLSSQNQLVGLSGFVGFLETRAVGASGCTLPNTRAQFFSNVDSYSQVNHQNISAGTLASTDFIATADNGTDTSNYVDLGINSSNYNLSSYGITGPNDAYLYSQSSNLAIGTIGATSSLIFHTSGAKSVDERMRITSTGNIGIGTSTPASKLTVIGDISATGRICASNAIFINNGTSVRPSVGNNTSSGLYSFIANGVQNTASGDFTYAATGSGNSATEKYAVVIGGTNNTSSSIYSTIINGTKNQANGCATFIGTGYCNAIIGASDDSVIIGGNNNTINTASDSFIGTGCCNYINGYSSVIVGGTCNSTDGYITFIGGGECNCIFSGVYNTFVFGSEIQASLSDTTYVNNLLSLSSVSATALYGDGTYITGVVKPSEMPYQFYPGSGTIAALSGNNFAYSDYSFIAGGSDNNTMGFANTFILGTGLSAVSANYTYVNNISSQGVVTGDALVGQNLYIGSSILGSVTGTSVSKFPVYTKDGSFLGYVPIYA